MSGLEFYVIDTESTGLSVVHHELIEISVIRVSNKFQINRQMKADNPRTASFDALRITGKTMEDLSIGISKQQAIDDVNNFFAEDGLTPAHRCIIGHNIISFDKRFLHTMWARNNHTFPADMWVDTMGMMREYVKSLPKKIGEPKQKINLHASCDLLGVKKIALAHNAKDDSRNNFLLWKKLLEEKMDYLGFIKRHPHSLGSDEEEID